MGEDPHGAHPEAQEDRSGREGAVGEGRGQRGHGDHPAGLPLRCDQVQHHEGHEAREERRSMADPAGAVGRVIGRALFRVGNRIAQTLLLVGFGMSAAAVADGTGSRVVSLMNGPIFSNELEGSLVRAIVGLRQAGMRQAMVEIDNALEHHPNFRLGYMVKGDMLMAQAGRPVAFAASSATAESVAPLQDEARVRLQRYLDAPRVDEMPAPVLQLAPNQRHALVVDTSRNRLYVFANDGGRPRYVSDFYVSIGKLGAEKQRAGDQKTPTG